ncbi:Ppx/GppA phosphatase family protein [Rhodococcus sp. NPDC057014]|uniref:Ppx/GppA phosphatase family protein n=1 Tax=Rhodococcus sp. NPDC057014 TaxID=3346000 RepID=UPI003632ECEC
MRLGVLDIGSNSAQLQIVEATAGAPPLPLHAVKAATRLGESIGVDQRLDEDGIDRISQAVTQTLAAAHRYEVDQVYLFVTAAIRDAANRDDILDRIAAECGLRPQFLTGLQEARLTYLAVHRWYGWRSGRLLDIDIGGGSMEIALGRDAVPELAVSLPLGAGRLTRGFFDADPPPRKQVKALRRYVRDTLRETADRLRWEGEPQLVVATSKTFKQLARLTGAPSQRKGPFVRRTLSRKKIHSWVPRLAKLPAERRAGLRGVSPSRAEQILAGAIVADETLGALHVDAVQVSPWALREGVMLHYLSTVTDPRDELPLHPLQPVTPRAPEGGATVTALTTSASSRSSTRGK